MRYCKCGATDEAAYSPSQWQRVLGVDKRASGTCRACNKRAVVKYARTEHGQQVRRAARPNHKASLPPGCRGFDRHDLENDRLMRNEYEKGRKRRHRAGQATALRDRRKYGMDDE